jgi:hypothetical protein
MNKDSTKISLATLLFISALFLHGCKSDEGSLAPKAANNDPLNRRVPSDNAKVAKSINMAMDNVAKEIKKVDPDYDAYQSYESVDAPISLKEMKKIKRRPVLNVQELNNISVTAPKDVHKPVISNTNPKKAKFQKKPCTEAHCNLQEVIKYNKEQKLEKDNSAKQDSVPAVSEPAISAISDKPKESVPQAIPTNMPVNFKPIVRSADVVSPAISPAKTNADLKSVEEIKPESKLPAVSLPEIKISNDKNVMPVPLKSQPKTEASKETSSPLKDVSKPDIAQVQQEVKSPDSKAPAAIVKIKDSNEGKKLESINILLIDCYYTIKNKISGLFSY